MKTVVIALLDKAWPPEHSFVDGMLAAETTRRPGIGVRLCVSRAYDSCSGSRSRARRYRRAACLACLHPRRGFGRLLNLWAALRLIAYQAARERRRGRRLVVFVRNDPMLLLAASLLRRRVDRVVFQSSFPQEEFNENPLKRVVARSIYRLASSGVDAITAVSPIGLERVRKLCPAARVAEYIPLLADLQPLREIELRSEATSQGAVTRFVYMGTHRAERSLEVVLSGIVQAVDKGANATFLFVGAGEQEILTLSRVDRVQKLIKTGTITFQRAVPRKQTSAVLAQADVGVSLIPLRSVYYESSPTKLAEYMGSGLAVLASLGIPMQEKFVTEARAGVLAEWDSSAIAAGICQMSADRNKLAEMKKHARRYAETHLQYAAYIPQFTRLIHE